mmetsp:Transcript_5903/g.10541  ORF Transcript_5903/g.10541 Transcript_5903/m.10541 type:complete len:561 (-) Transcript_5903:23-1705(-)
MPPLAVLPDGAAAGTPINVIATSKMPGMVEDIEVISSRSQSPRSRSPLSPGARKVNKKGSGSSVSKLTAGQSSGKIEGSPNAQYKSVLQGLNEVKKSPTGADKKLKKAAMEGQSLKMAGGRRSSSKSTRTDLVASGQTAKLKAFDLLNNQKFDGVIGVIIFFNSMSIGWESTCEISGCDYMVVFQVMENLFLAIYVFELGLRFYVIGCACLNNGWVRFDAMLVGMGVVTSWIVTPIVLPLLETAGGDIGNPKDMLAPILVLRVLRLFRLVRAVRLLVQFKTLWMLVRGLLNSAGTILYTCMLISLMLYITACLAVELITKPHMNSGDEFMEGMVKLHWSSIPEIMLTLVQFVTFDSIGSIYAPMIKRDPKLLIIFIPFLLIVSIALMNLVTAVIVESAIEQGRTDKEVEAEYKKQMIKEMMPSLLEMFRELDVNGDGTITSDEIMDCGEDMKEELLKYMNAESLLELFEMLDVDGSGEVNIDEFCDGISKLASSEQPVEFIRILKQVSAIKNTQSRHEETFKAILASQKAIENSMKTIISSQTRTEQRLKELEPASSSRG